MEVQSLAVPTQAVRKAARAVFDDPDKQKWTVMMIRRANECADGERKAAAAVVLADMLGTDQLLPDAVATEVRKSAAVKRRARRQSMKVLQRAHNLEVLGDFNRGIAQETRDRIVARASGGASRRSSGAVHDPIAEEDVEGGTIAEGEEDAGATDERSAPKKANSLTHMHRLAMAHTSSFAGPLAMAHPDAEDTSAAERRRAVAIERHSEAAHVYPAARACEVTKALLDLVRGGAHQSPVPTVKDPMDFIYTQEIIELRHFTRVKEELKRAFLLTASFLDAPKQDHVKTDDLDLFDEGVASQLAPRTRRMSSADMRAASADRKRRPSRTNRRGRGHHHADGGYEKPTQESRVAVEGVNLTRIINAEECAAGACKARFESGLLADPQGELANLEQLATEMIHAVLFLAALIADTECDGDTVEAQATECAAHCARWPFFALSHAWREHEMLAVCVLDLDATRQARTRMPLTVEEAMVGVVRAFRTKAQLLVTGQGAIRAMRLRQRAKEVKARVTDARRKAARSPSPPGSRRAPSPPRATASPRATSLPPPAKPVDATRRAPTGVAPKIKYRETPRALRMYAHGTTKLLACSGRRARDLPLRLDDRGFIISCADGTLKGERGKISDFEVEKALQLSGSGAMGAGFAGFDCAAGAVHAARHRRRASASLDLSQIATLPAIARRSLSQSPRARKLSLNGLPEDIGRSSPRGTPREGGRSSFSPRTSPRRASSRRSSSATPKTRDEVVTEAIAQLSLLSNEKEGREKNRGASGAVPNASHELRKDRMRRASFRISKQVRDRIRVFGDNPDDAQDKAHLAEGVEATPRPPPSSSESSPRAGSRSPRARRGSLSPTVRSSEEKSRGAADAGGTPTGAATSATRGRSATRRGPSSAASDAVAKRLNMVHE
jgi:hypothetical protein